MKNYSIIKNLNNSYITNKKLFYYLNSLLRTYNFNKISFKNISNKNQTKKDNLKSINTTTIINDNNTKNNNIITNLSPREFDFNISTLMQKYDEIEKQKKLNEKTLDNKIIELIKKKGPLTLEEYTQICLFDSEFGYYSTKDYVFGSKGDFITAPEISQLFGEMISIWLYKQLEEFGFPNKYDLLEIGPGRGFLATDIIRSFYNINMLNNNNKNLSSDKNTKDNEGEFNYYFIDMSPKLRKVQQENVYNCLVKLKMNPKYGTIKARENKGFINVRK